MRAIIALCMILIMTDVSGEQPAATITCRVRDQHSGSLRVILPVDHTVLWAAAKEMPLGKNGELVIPVSKSQTGYIMIFGFQKALRLFVQPGDHLEVDIDSSSTSVPNITGHNSEGQALLSKNKFPASYYSIESVFWKDSTPALLAAHIEMEKAKNMQPFRELFANHAIDSAFMHFITQHFDYLYATVAVKRISNRFYSMINYTKGSPEPRKDFTQVFRDYWNDILNRYPVNRSDGYRVQTFEYYVDDYINAYLSFIKWEKNDTTTFRTDAEYKLHTIASIRNTFQDRQLAQQVEARRLYFMFIQEKFEEVLPRMVADFNQTYPGSAYMAALKPYSDKVLSFYQRAANDFSGDQQIVHQYLNIHSFEQLKALFKGKMFYIDMWATWCGPCKAEFEYEKDLSKFLKEKGIEMVFISMDTDDRDGQWQNMIKYYGLSGYHIRTGELLRKDLSKRFWNLDNGYTIPRYVLVNTAGNIVENDALRPSDKEKLYAQIASHL